MILQVVAAFDVKARAFMRPFFVPHIDVGIRTFAEAANTPDHQVCIHPEDFSLYHLGTWNDETAAFLLPSIPVLLCTGVQFKKGMSDVQSKVA